jgi:methionine salvage enolase-phosphatase E1
MQVEAGAIRFYSDVVRELDPAREVGCQTRLVVREGNAPVAEAHGHRVIDTLDGEL